MATQLPVRLNIEFDDPQLSFNPPVYEEKFFSGTGFRKEYSLINTGGYIPVDISNFAGTLEKIIVIPKDVFTPASKTTVRLKINNGVDPVYYTYLPMKKFLLYTIHEDEVSYIKEMHIKTNSITSVNVEVQLVSVVPAPSVV